MKNLKLELKKEASLVTWTVGPAPIPAFLHIPLEGPCRGPVEVAVRPGQRVSAGDVLAYPLGSEGVRIYTGFSGRVRDVEGQAAPSGSRMKSVRLEVDTQASPQVGLAVEKENWESLSDEELLESLQLLGVTHMDETFRPLHGTLRKDRRSRPKALLINVCESEPYLTSHYALAMSHPIELIKMARRLQVFLKTEEVIWCLEEDKLELAELLRSKIYFLNWNDFRVEVFKARYPTDMEEVLQAWYERVRPNGAVSYSKSSILQVSTLFAAYEAIAKEKPLVERAVTIGGECVVEPRNRWVRFGTAFEDCLKMPKGILREPGKWLMGGPMRGTFQPSAKVPVTAATHGILGIPRELVEAEPAEPCNFCGHCAEVCPSELVPALIYKGLEAGNPGFAKIQGLDSCIECGNCTYRCPSKIPLSAYFRAGKIQMGNGNIFSESEEAGIQPAMVS